MDEKQYWKMDEKNDRKGAENTDVPDEKNDNSQQKGSHQEPGIVLPREIEDEMKQSYLDYSMAVIVGRALPDVRDGLKPVHRRILFAMHDMGMHFNKPFKKSARIVGEVLGKYHPHGDSAVYDAMVRMTQDFSLRYPLVQGQGNFGSIDGDSAAAMRYTEARLAKISQELLLDIEKETVDFTDNFDASLKEPTVLPAKLPNLLINGATGIAVGMATNIPPHNLTEVADGAIALINNPDVTTEELLKIVTGPDFPTGGLIIGRKGIEYAYRTGRGRAIIRAKTHMEEVNKRQAIIVTEIPYMVNKATLLENIAAMVHEKKIEGIHDIRDESDRDGMRIVFELKSGANTEIVQNQLFKHSRLQDSFGIIMLSLVNNVPKVLTLKRMLEEYLEHRKIVVRRRAEYDLKKAQEKAHILEGLIIALDDIDNVIEKIKKSKDTAAAASMLIKDYGLTEVQAKAVLEMRLSRLASLEQQKIREEHAELMRLIKELREILADEKKILRIIRDELEDIRDKFGDDRRSQIIDCNDDDYEIDMESLIEPEEMIVTISHRGYVKRLPIDTYRQQRRGGKGVKAAGTKEDDFIESLFVATTQDFLMFFTNLGTCHRIKVYKIHEAGRTALGTAIVNLIELEEGEKVEAFVSVSDFSHGNIMLATKKGTIKKTQLSLFSRPRRGGIIAISLNDGDELIGARVTSGDDNIIIATKKGMAVKFNEKDIRATGRSSQGVRGIRLRGEDEVVGMVEGDNNKTLFTITENGYGKRTQISDYRLISRGGSGVINIKCTERNGNVSAVRAIDNNDDIMFISKKGIAIRVPSSGISTIGRNTQGVRLMKLSSDDKVVAAAKMISEEKEEQEIEKEEAAKKEAPRPAASKEVPEGEDYDDPEEEPETEEEEEPEEESEEEDPESPEEGEEDSDEDEDEPKSLPRKH